MKISSFAFLYLAAVTAQSLASDRSVTVDLSSPSGDRETFSTQTSLDSRDVVMTPTINSMSIPENIEIADSQSIDSGSQSNLILALAPGRLPEKSHRNLTISHTDQQLAKAIEESWLAQLVKAGFQHIPALQDNKNNTIAWQTNDDIMFDQGINPTVTLLNALLVVSTTLPVFTIGFFWLVRRMVVKELITDVNKRLNNIAELEAKVKTSDTLATELVSKLELNIATIKKELEFVHREAIISQSSIEQIERVKTYLIKHLESTIQEVESYKQQATQHINKVLVNPEHKTNIALPDQLPEISKPPANFHQETEASNSSGEVALESAATTFFKQGEAAFQSGRFERALVLFERATECDPNYYEAWYNCGNTLEKLQRYEEAVISYQKAIKIDPNRYESWYNLGNLLVRLKQYQEALECYQKVVAIKPDFYEIWYNQGIVLGRLQKNIEAANAYEKAIAIKPDRYEAWYNRGNSLRRLQRYEEAIICYNQAIEINPNKYEPWYNCGASQAMLGNYEEALICYNQSIQLKSDDYEAWHNRGAVLEKLGRYAESIESYQGAIKLKPDCYVAWFGQGESFQKLKRYQEAIAAYEQAITINQNASDAWRNKGEILSELKQYQEAIEAYEKAIALNPNDSEAWHCRGVILSELKQFDAAINSMDQALALQRHSRRQSQQTGENHNNSPVVEAQVPLPALWT